MKLRKLELKDAPLMLEWMHDDSVVHDMKTDFASKTLEDCITFIKAAQVTTENLHLAVVDDNDIYMGTVSLKNIHEDAAEFAITVRKHAMGKGYARNGMERILKLGLEDLGLKKIYWYVSPDNLRALRFYDKNGYMRTKKNEIRDMVAQGGKNKYIWYLVCREDWNNTR